MDPTRLHAPVLRAATCHLPPRRHSFVTTSRTPKSHSSGGKTLFIAAAITEVILPSVLLSLRLICSFTDIPLCLFFKCPLEGTDFPACFCSVLSVFYWPFRVTSVLSPHLPHPRGQPLTWVLCTSRLMETERQRMSQARKGPQFRSVVPVLLLAKYGV